MAMRAVLYLRVSTLRQAEQGISIPDQRAQAERYCREQGWAVVGEYADEGISGRTASRPQFQRMMEDATAASG